MNQGFLLSKRYYFLWVAVGLLLLSACDREVPNAQLPNVQSKLVVNSFISPQDSLLQVYVYESAPVPGKPASSELIQNATVTLSDGNRNVLLPGVKQFNSLQFTVYQVLKKDFPIEVGKTYFLKVTVPDGRAVEAQCTVPTVNNTLQIKVDSVTESRFGTPRTVYKFIYRWQHPARQETYYRTAGEFSLNSPDGTGGVSGNVGWDARNEFFSVPANGVSQTLTTTSSADFFYNQNNQNYRKKLDGYLLTTDVHYYRYHTTLRNARDADGNPFAEPVLVYSNMKNGLGVFAAYNRHTVRVRF